MTIGSILAELVNHRLEEGDRRDDRRQNAGTMLDREAGSSSDMAASIFSASFAS
jgi:hypothetical protein